MATTSKPGLFGVREKLKPVVLSPTKVRQLRNASGLSVAQAAALLSMDELGYRELEVSGSGRQFVVRQPMNSSKAILFQARLQLVRGNLKGALEVMAQRLPAGAKGLLAREAIESLGSRPLASQWVPGEVVPVALNAQDVQQMRHASGLTLAEAALLLDRHPQYFGVYEADEQGPAVTHKRMSRPTADLFRAGTALAAGFAGAALDVLAQTIAPEFSSKAVAALEALRGGRKRVLKLEADEIGQRTRTRKGAWGKTVAALDAMQDSRSLMDAWGATVGGLDSLQDVRSFDLAVPADDLMPGAFALMDAEDRGSFLTAVRLGIDWPALNQLVMPSRTRGSSYVVLVRWWLLKYFSCWGDIKLHRLVLSEPSLMEFLGSGLTKAELPSRHDSMRFAKRLQDLNLEKTVLAFVEKLAAFPPR